MLNKINYTCIGSLKGSKYSEWLTSTSRVTTVHNYVSKGTGKVKNVVTLSGDNSKLSCTPTVNKFKGIAKQW